ncbi:MAG: GAF domain-containing protein [Anaerolineae bacterium]|nr:GAF domain-containing protein [Anaerolineae bacterium]
MLNASPDLVDHPERLSSLRQLNLLDTPAEPAFDRLTQLACHILATPIAVISLLDDDREFIKSQVGLGEPWATQREFPLDHSYCQHVVAARSALFIGDTHRHPQVHDNRLTLELGAAAFAGIPLALPDGVVVGAFSVFDMQPRIWTDDEIAALTEIAAAASTEIALRSEQTARAAAEQALGKAESALEHTRQRLTLLRRIQVELSETLDLDSVLTIAMDTAQRASGAEHGFIGLLEGEQLRLVHAVGSYVTGSVWRSDTGIIGRALQTGEPQLILDADANPDVVHDIPGVKAQMAIPLVHRDHLIGVINLKTARSKLFTQEAFEFLGTVASHITVAIDNAQLYQVSQQQLEELHLLYMRVSELEQLKTDMIRIAAHDLRNPLGVVKASAELMLEDDSLTVEQRDFLGSIQEAGNKMIKIINDILSLQRIETMQTGKHRDHIDLNQLIRSVFTGNEPRAQKKAQEYRLVLPEESILVYADAAQMREALDNLIGNAIKYTPGGGVVIVRAEQQADRIVVEVEDSGLGIPEDQQSRLFQPFFRASNARASKIEGTGLGLHLVKNIIERHGGMMRFRSALGKGSVFGFEMPL